MIRSLPFVPSSCYHDFKYYSIFYGEPFLFEDYLYYFDGWDLTVIGYDRYGNAIEENTFENLLTSVLDQWQVRSVTLETPKRLRLGNPS